MIDGDKEKKVDNLILNISKEIWMKRIERKEKNYREIMVAVMVKRFGKKWTGMGFLVI